MGEILDNVFFGDQCDDGTVEAVLADIAYVQRRSDVPVHNGRTETDYASSLTPQPETSPDA